jgi:hypothetical protein
MVLASANDGIASAAAMATADAIVERFQREMQNIQTLLT